MQPLDIVLTTIAAVLVIQLWIAAMIISLTIEL